MGRRGWCAAAVLACLEKALVALVVLAADQTQVEVRAAQAVLTEQTQMATHTALAVIMVGDQVKDIQGLLFMVLRVQALFVLFGPDLLVNSHQPIQVICNELLYSY